MHIPVDAGLLLSYTVLASLALVVPAGDVSPVLGLAVAPLVLFAPGYAILMGLFPQGEDELDTRSSPVDGSPRLTLSERVALAFAFSVVLLSALGILLVESGLGLTRGSVVGGVDVFIVAGMCAGIARDHRPLHRDVTVRSWLASVRAATLGSDSRAVSLANLSLVIAVCLWAGAFGLLLLTPAQGASYSELSLVTESPNGSYVAAEYPQTFELGSGRPMVAAVSNHEGEPTDYTLVVQFQRVRSGDTGVQVLERRTLHRFGTTIAANETWYREHTLRPTMAGDDLRVVYLLYRSDAPERPTISNAYRHGYVWISVDRGETAAR